MLVIITIGAKLATLILQLIIKIEYKIVDLLSLQI